MEIGEPYAGKAPPPLPNAARGGCLDAPKTLRHTPDRYVTVRARNLPAKERSGMTVKLGTGARR